MRKAEKIKIAEIDVDVTVAKQLAVSHGGKWDSFIDWHTYSTLGFTHVKFDGNTYNFHRFGLLENVSTT